MLAGAALDRDVDLDSLTADLPLVSRTSRGDWSIHPLWQPLLAREVSEAAVADARRRAGTALAASGDVAAAVRLLTKAAAWEDVTSVVVDALGAALPPVPGDIVTAWLGRLPESRKDAPLGRLLDAVSTVQTDPRRAAQRLDDAAASFRGRGELQGELACISQLAQLAWWSEQPERMAALAARAFEMEAAGHPHAVPLACLARALIADLANNSTAALAELDRIALGSLNHNWQSLVAWLRSTSLNNLGRPAEALDAAEGACALAGPLHAPLIETARLQALWFLGHVDDVVDELPALVDRAAAVGLRNYAALMAASCCLALAVVGRPQEASRHLERARRIAASREIPLVDVNLTVAQAAARHRIRRRAECDAGARELPRAVTPARCGPRCRSSAAQPGAVVRARPDDPGGVGDRQPRPQFRHRPRPCPGRSGHPGRSTLPGATGRPSAPRVS